MREELKRAEKAGEQTKWIVAETLVCSLTSRLAKASTSALFLAKNALAKSTQQHSL